MTQEDHAKTSGRASRRGLLRGLATGGTIGVAALAGCGSDDPATATPPESVDYVLSTALSAQYGKIGENEERGFKMAVQHLNEGGGLVKAGAFDALDGDGVLGRTVDDVVINTESDPETARSGLIPFVKNGLAPMFCGGVTGRVVQEHREIAVEHDVPYFAGTSVLSELTGDNCAAQVYREMYSSRALMGALGPTLIDEFGDSVQYYQLYADNAEGNDLKDAFNDYFGGPSAANWEPRGTDAIRPGSTNFEQKINRAESGRPEVVVMNLFGLDAANALSAAEKHLSDDIGLVVPLIDDSVGAVAGDAVADVVGTLPWDAGIDSGYTEPYNISYLTNYGRSAGGTAQAGSAAGHVVYVQTLQFSAAAERAGSFDPQAVRSELDSVEYDVGLGSQTMQSCNHQSTRPVPIVRGQTGTGADGNHFELLGIEHDVAAGCDSDAASSCSL